MKTRVLVVEDDPDMGDLVAAGLARRGFPAEVRRSADAAFDLLGQQDFDVVVTDLNMRGMNGVDLCARIAANRPDVPVVIITAFGSLETAIATMRAGAFDLLTKPFDIEQLVLTVERAATQRALREEVRRLRSVVDAARGFEELVGQSPAMLAVFDLLARVASSDATALVTGESGTGKELVARALHRRGKRADSPLVALNCAAVPEGLLESELFGHARGAFTDARHARRGLFVQADGGTLFLDEIGDMPLATQAKVLRALEERRVRPLGADAEVPFDVRLVAATNRDLETLVTEGRFREDLLYRIEVVRIELPPLRSRGSDVLLLAQRFLERFATAGGKPVRGMSGAVAERLLGYAWPGNVRELQNCIERAVALARFEELTVEDLPPKICDYKPSHVLVTSPDPSELVSMDEVEARYIRRVLECVGWHKTHAARVLGFDRSTLYRKMDRYGIVPPDEAR